MDDDVFGLQILYKMLFTWVLLTLAELQPVFSSQILESEWADHYCNGPPNVMLVFNVTSLKMSKPSPGETWPELYTLFRTENPSGKCGQCNTELLACCQNALIGSKMKSASSLLLKDDTINFEENMYSAANNHKYCLLNPITGTLFTGFKNISLLSDSKCIYGNYKCHNNGTLQVYPESNCQGSASSFILQDSPINFYNDDYGEFEARMNIYSSGMRATQWHAYTPYGLLKPFSLPNDRNIVWDYWLIIQLCLSLFLYLIGLVYGIVRYFQSKKPFMKWLIFSQTLFVLLSIHNFFENLYDYKTNDEYYMMVVQGNYLYGIATLSSALLTTYQAHSFCKEIMKNRRIFVYITSTLIILHFVTNGAVYFSFCYLSWFSNWNYCTSDFRMAWRSLIYYWIIIMFIWNIAPVTILAFKLIEHLTANQNIKKIGIVRKLWKYDRCFILTLIAQILIIFIYFGYYNWLNFNLVFGSDRAIKAANVGKPLIRAFHANLNLVLLERIPVLHASISVKTYKSSIIQSVAESNITRAPRTTPK